MLQFTSFGSMSDIGFYLWISFGLVACAVLLHQWSARARLAAGPEVAPRSSRSPISWLRLVTMSLATVSVVWTSWLWLTVSADPGFHLRQTLGLLLIMALLELIQIAGLRLFPSVQSMIKTYFGWAVELLAWLLIASAVRLSWLLPPYDVPISSALSAVTAWLPRIESAWLDDVLRLFFGPFPSSMAFIKISVWLLALFIALEVAPATHKSIGRMRVASAVSALTRLLATVSIILVLVLLPREFVVLRNFILANLVFCGGVTLWRQFRRRWRTGDRSLSSLTGGLIVVVQFLSLIMVIGGTLAALLTIPLWVVIRLSIAENTNSLLIASIDIWTHNLASMLFVLSLFYATTYAIRRLTGSRGLSWFDPPNFRVVWRDLLYDKTRNVDLMREAFIRAIVGDARPDLATAIDEAARIVPVAEPKNHYAFSIVGDPGEGDDSQLYPIRGARTEVLKQATDDEHVDFMIISSDVIYPAGELMDYERAVYRPFRTNQPGRPPQNGIPIYALPGNHDWYDDLNGFLANFGYAAAHETKRTPWRDAMRRGPWAMYGGLLSGLRWGEIRRLRERYGLEKLGGIPQQPESQQRLPFFEISFADQGVPLTVIAVDTGCTGSVDALQRAWLERCLLRARDQLKLVLLSTPLYVDGKFDTQGMHAELYQLLRAHRVDVVMGGDTHTYQQYEVRYTADGREHVMYHIVNGGGGAYLSCPMDGDWICGYAGGPMPLDDRYVFHDAQCGPDRVVLHNLFPSAEMMRAKFGPQKNRRWDRTAGDAWLNRIRAWYESRILAKGFTNFLEHDRLPLLQSFVEAHMHLDAQGWRLVLIPNLAQGPDGDQTLPPVEWERLPVEIARALAMPEPTAAVVIPADESQKPPSIPADALPR
ncbi:MAG TPA: metallophosphoesterase [Herpetosiphonaceae bacterium]